MREKKKFMFSIFVVSLFYLLAGCSNTVVSRPEGEVVDEVEAASILDEAILANLEFDSLATEFSQEMKGNVDGERFSVTMLVSMEIVGDEAVWMRSEMDLDGEEGITEVIYVDGNQYSRRDDAEWRFAGEYTDEDLEDSENSYDYLTAVQELAIDYEIIESEEAYHFYVETLGDQAFELANLILEGSDLTGSNTVNGIEQASSGQEVSKLTLIVDIDKDTFYQVGFALQVEAEYERDGMTANWEQTMHGTFYDFNEVGPITAPEEADVNNPFNWVEMDDGMETENFEEVYSNWMLTQDDIESYAVKATYRFEDKKSGEVLVVEDEGRVSGRGEEESYSFTVIEDINGEEKITEIYRNFPDYYYRENEGNWHNSSYRVAGRSMPSSVESDFIYGNRSDFFMRTFDGKHTIVLEENVGRTLSAGIPIDSRITQRTPFNDLAEDIGNRLNRSEAIVRMIAVFDEQTKQFEQLDYELDQEDFNLSLHFSYSEINEVEEIIIPQDVIDEAEGE